MSTTESRIRAKADSEAMTDPNPTRLAVLKIGSSEAWAPASRVVFSLGRRDRFTAIITRIEMTRATMMDQMPRTESIVVAPYSEAAR